jgi:hypothetical protein
METLEEQNEKVNNIVQFLKLNIPICDEDMVYLIDHHPNVRSLREFISTKQLERINENIHLYKPRTN